MSAHSNIAWTNSTWNPIRGCSRVSEGCRNCYAEVMAARHSYDGGWGHEVAHYVGGEPRWTNVIEVAHIKTIEAPLHWRTPRRVFVNSMSDLFHEKAPFNVVDRIFDIMESVACGKHTFQILTKRPERMRKYLRARWSGGPVPAAMRRNIWIGVSAEDQATFDERVPVLLDTPAAVRWVSLEPLLGHIDLIGKDEQGSALHAYEGRPRLDWGVVGGESGSGYRPMGIEDARYIIRQFTDAAVPLFVKQDNGPRPGMKGRFTAEEWALKAYPS